MKRTGESDRIRPGQEVVPPVDVPGLGKVGLEICYDLRFPELHIILTRLGAQILTFPSAFTVKTGRDHWGKLFYCCSCKLTDSDSLRKLTISGS